MAHYPILCNHFQRFTLEAVTVGRLVYYQINQVKADPMLFYASNWKYLINIECINSINT